MPDTINNTTPPAFLPGLENLQRTLPSWAVWLLHIALIAAAYWISGKLGLLLAIPPGYATAVWPPSGIALAGLLFFGYRAWPGVWLGSFLVNVGISFDANTTETILKSLSIASCIGVGATLQAAAGVWLIRRYVGFPNALDQERDIIRFLFLGGPLSCFVNATIGVGTLWAHGIIPTPALAFSWWTWWTGDALGILTLTPLILIFFATPRAVWQQRRYTVAVPLVAIFALAVLVFVLVSGNEQRRIESIFEQRTQALTRALDESLGNYVQILQSIESFYASSSKVERHQFHTYVQRMFDKYPGIQALSWNPRVPTAERAAYEAAARRDGHASFQFTERDAGGRLVRAAPRAEYVPVYFSEPYVGNEVALGFDLASNAVRLAALSRARDTGQPTATAGVRLVQKTGQQTGILICLPLYAQNLTADTVTARRHSLRGYAIGAFHMATMVDAVLKNQDQSDWVLRIEDTAATADGAHLYGPPLEAGAGTSARVVRTTLDIAGRQWALSFTPTPDYLAAQRSWAPWLVLAAGLLFNALLGTFLLVLTGRTSRIEQLVKTRTAELARSNAELEQFAYVASHDLKEPLRMVGSFTELLARRYQGKLDKDADEYIGFMLDGVRRMQQLINDLLAYSRITRGGQALTLTAADAALAAALANLKQAIGESAATVSADPLPPVYANASQLMQLFQNLIGNAIKFRAEAAPVVHISAQRRSEQWLFSVQDNGIGIEPQYRERIFAIFQRLHTREAYPGTGIGLALCKRIVEQHGGKIWLESEPGRGSTFFFNLPVKPKENL